MLSGVVGNAIQYEAVIRIDAFVDSDTLGRFITRLLLHGGVAVSPESRDPGTCHFKLTSPSFSAERDFRQYVTQVLAESKIKFRFV